MGERFHRFFDQHNEKKLVESWDPSKKPEANEAKATNQMEAAGIRNASRLFLSLLSGLPNEQDFGLNVCVLLSNEGSLQLTNKMVQVLVAQAGVWQQEDLKMLYTESWQDVEGRQMHQFWKTTLQDTELLAALELDMGECERDDASFWNLDSNASSLESEGQRVMKVALILHNLSFEKENVPVLVNSSIFIRFLLLSIHSSWCNLKQTALDTLANIAYEMCLIPKDNCTSILIRCVSEGLVSEDRFVSLRCMDVLGQLCGRTPNDELLPPSVQPHMYERLVSFLTVHDIMLLFYTLEALYSLSDLGRQPCDRIAQVHSAISVLVNLLTLDPAQYGPSAEIRMKLVEILVPAEPGEQRVEEPVTVASTTAEVSVVASPTIVTVASKDVNSETFATNWLKSHYEIFPGSLVSRNEIYADYVGFCTKAERKGVVNANVFANCVKNCFPHVELKKVQSSGGIITFHHDGLRKKRMTPIATSAVSVASSAPVKPVASPILQAHLSSPSEPPKMAAVAISPAPQQSTLIKSMLAKKVVQPSPRQVLPQMLLGGGGGGKMLIFSPGKGGSPGTVRCVMPQVNIQGTRFIAPQPKVVQAQVNGQVDTASPKSEVVQQPVVQLNCVQSNPPKDNSNKEVSLSQPVAVGDQNFILSQIQGNTITYRLASPEEITLNAGNRLFVRSKGNEAEQNGAVVLSSKATTAVQPKNTTEIEFQQAASKKPPVVACRPQQPDICKKSPLLNGLLDKGPQKRPMSSDILFNALVENGIEASDVGLELRTTSPDTPPMPEVKSPTSVVLPSEPSLNSLLLKTKLENKTMNSILLPQSAFVAANNPPSANIIGLNAGSVKGNLGGQSVVNTVASNILVSNAIASNLCGQNVFKSVSGSILGLNAGAVKTVASNLGSQNVVNTVAGSILGLNANPVNSVAGNLVVSSVMNTMPGSIRAQNVITTVGSLNLNASAVSTVAGNILVSNATNTLVGNPRGQNMVNASTLLGLNASTVNSVAGNIVISNTVNTIAGNLSGQNVINAGSILNMNALNSVAANTMVSSSANASAPSTNGASFAVANGSGGSSLVCIRSGQSTFSGTAELQPDQTGVVRLHIESPENSNQGDLSSISDIARTLECASEAISRTNAECNTQVPQDNSASAANTSESSATLGQSDANTVSGSSAVSQVLVNTLPTNLNSVVNTVTGGSVIVQGGMSKVGSLLSQSAVNSIASNHVAHSVANTVVGSQVAANSVAGNIISQSAVNSMAVVTNSSSSVPSNILGQVGGSNLVGLNAGSILGLNAVNSVLGQRNQQIFVVTSPGSQQSMQNIKFCILHTVPVGEESSEAPVAPQVALAENSNNKRPSSEPVCVPNKKPRIQISIPERPSTPQSQEASETKTLSGLASSSGDQVLPAPSKTTSKMDFVCEWKNCGLKFSRPSHVFLHFAHVHTPPSVHSLPCMWEGCDSMKRRRLSLLTHTQDWHCNDRVLHHQASRRANRGGQLPPPPKPPPHPGYAPDAAVLAIKRHALQYNNPKELEEEKESPLTKSIRLTSALILRNLVMHSPIARTCVRRFEGELAYLAMSPVECSKAVAQCLFHLSCND